MKRLHTTALFGRSLQTVIYKVCVLAPSHMAVCNSQRKPAMAIVHHVFTRPHAHTLGRVQHQPGLSNTCARARCYAGSSVLCVASAALNTAVLSSTDSHHTRSQFPSFGPHACSYPWASAFGRALWLCSYVGPRCEASHAESVPHVDAGYRLRWRNGRRCMCIMPRG